MPSLIWLYLSKYTKKFLGDCFFLANDLFFNSASYNLICIWVTWESCSTSNSKWGGTFIMPRWCHICLLLDWLGSKALLYMSDISWKWNSQAQKSQEGTKPVLFAYITLLLQPETQVSLSRNISWMEKLNLKKNSHLSFSWIVFSLYFLEQCYFFLLKINNYLKPGTSSYILS